MGTRNEVTIHDLARVLELSTSTISRALQGSPAVREQTRSRIAQVASELGYQRNYFASRLRAQSTRILGGMVTHLNTPLASSILSGAESAASKMGYGMLVHQTMNDPELRSNTIENLKNHRVDGVLIASNYFQECAGLDQVASVNAPVVVVDASSLLDGLPKKKITDFDNALELTNYLAEKGCRRIEFMSVDLPPGRHANLLAGYRKALQKNSIQEGDRFVLNSQDPMNPWATIVELLASTPSGPDGLVFFGSTVTALVFVPPESREREEYWITWRKTSLSSQQRNFVEIGKLSASLLISASLRKTDSADPKAMS